MKEFYVILVPTEKGITCESLDDLIGPFHSKKKLNNYLRTCKSKTVILEATRIGNHIRFDNIKDQSPSMKEANQEGMYQLGLRMLGITEAESDAAEKENEEN